MAKLYTQIKLLTHYAINVYCIKEFPSCGLKVFKLRFESLQVNL